MADFSSFVRTFFNKKLLILLIISFFLLVFGLSELFIGNQAFEKFYDFSRHHEAWEMDEFALIFISSLISFFLLTIIVLLKFIFAMKKYNQHLIDHEKQIAYGKKLQAMGSLLGGLAHSMNNHITPILTIGKILQEELPHESIHQKDLTYLMDAANSTRVTLKQILNFSRHEEFDLVNHCQLNDAVKKSLDIARFSIPSTISMNIDLENTPVLVRTSQLNIEIMLLNMVSNAVDASHLNDGVITVTLQSLKNKNGSVNGARLIFEDNGMGIEKKNLERVFEPYFTTKPTDMGTGLGLSETYGIIKQAGGTIMVESEVGKFTRFTIDFPIMQ